jgi:hypothetical protein
MRVFFDSTSAPLSGEYLDKAICTSTASNAEPAYPSRFSMNKWNKTMTNKKLTDRKKPPAIAADKPLEPDMKALWAKTALSAELNAVGVSHQYLKGLIDLKDTSFEALTTVLHDTTKKVVDGDLRPIEKMLLSQATALQTIFTSLARRASTQEQLKHYEVFLNLGLKAQSQSRATLQALIELKLPRQAVFAKQANIAQGHQQVNNGTSDASRTEETHVSKNKLLEDKTNGGTYLDATPTTATSESDKAMATVATVNRADNKRRQG